MVTQNELKRYYKAIGQALNCPRSARNSILKNVKSDIEEYGFLNALNRLNFEVGYLKTVALSPEREIVYEKYKLRKAKIHKFRKMLKLRD